MSRLSTLRSSAASLRSLTLLALLVCVLARAAAAAQAPLPAQLSSAQSAFLTNAGGYDNKVTQVAYNAFYAGLAKWKHFRLAPTPATADLLLDLSMATQLTGGGGGPNSGHLLLRLDIRDSKTQALLWSISEPLKGSLIVKSSDRSIQPAVAKVLADLQAITSPSAQNSASDPATSFGST